MGRGRASRLGGDFWHQTKISRKNLIIHNHYRTLVEFLNTIDAKYIEQRIIRIYNIMKSTICNIDQYEGILLLDNLCIVNIAFQIYPNFNHKDCGFPCLHLGGAVF